MASITQADLNFWTDGSKFTITSVNYSKLDEFIASSKAALSAIYDTSSWTAQSLPETIKTIACMRYVGYAYLAASSGVTDVEDYGKFLLDKADSMETSLVEKPVAVSEMAINITTALRYTTSEPVFSMDKEW